MILDLHYGGAVSGTQRFARPELEERFLRHLASSAGIRMFGLRRIGKSTLRRCAEEAFAAERRPCIYVDGQGLHTLGDLLTRIAAATGRDGDLISRALKFAVGPAGKALKAFQAGEAVEEATLSAYWQHVSRSIREALREGVRPVLVIDEFSYLLSNMVKQGRIADIDPLLAAMREWREAGMTMLLTGSIGVVALARLHGFNREHLNDLYPFVIPELTGTEARAFLAAATEGRSGGRWTEAHTDEFLRQTVVLYPAFLVRGLIEVGISDPPAPAALAGIFADRIRPDLHNDFYQQFTRRFRTYAQLDAGEQQGLILPLLKMAMEAEKPVAQSALPVGEGFTRVDLDLALDMLAEDGFLSFAETLEGARAWRPASRLARLWWMRTRLA